MRETGTGTSLRLGDLPAGFRERADVLRECGAVGQASTLEWAADRAEEALRGAALEELTLDEAEIETGYSRSHLRRLIREEKIPATREGSRIRIQRRHLPHKPGVAGSGPTLTLRSQLARAVATGRGA